MAQSSGGRPRDGGFHMEITLEHGTLEYVRAMSSRKIFGASDAAVVAFLVRWAIVEMITRGIISEVRETIHLDENGHEKSRDEDD